MNNWPRAGIRLAVTGLAMISVAFSAGAAGERTKNKGPVNITIEAPLAKVREVMVAQLALQGFMVDSDSEYQMMFSKDVEGMMSELALRMLVGNAYSEKPQFVARFVFVKTKTGITVIGRQEVAARMAFGKVNRVSMDEGKFRSSFIDFLDRVKEEAEKSENENEVPLATPTANVTGQPAPQPVASSPTPEPVAKGSEERPSSQVRAEIWKSNTTGKEYRVQVDKDRFYAEWVNVPPESVKHGAFIRSECHRVGSKWIGTSSVGLLCPVGEGAKEHIANTCRLQLRIEIDSIGPDRIVGHGETLRRFDCQSCRVDEAGWGEFVWVPKKPRAGGRAR